MSNARKRAERGYAGEFVLTPRERSTYGVTVTARDLESGRTRTFVQTEMTGDAALRLIVAELDLLAGDWRILTVSSPTSIARDLFAHRVVLDGTHVGEVGTTPEEFALGRIKRRDMLHPPLGAAARYGGVTHRRHA